MALSKTTKDHDEIRQWAESRGAVPAEVESTESKGGPGILRFMFPKAPHHNDGALKEIEWDDFFEKFDANGLELIYQDVTKEGAESNFNKLVYPENESASVKKSAAKKGAAKQIAAKKTAVKSSATKSVSVSGSSKTTAKTVAGKSASATKNTAGKKAAPVTKTGEKVAPATKSGAKSAARTASDKPAAKKVAAKKTPAKKSGPAKKAVVKKIAARALWTGAGG